MSLIDDHTLRFMLFNEWKINSEPETATKSINERLNKNFITLNNVQKWFSCFDKGETPMFDDKSPLKVSTKNASFQNPFNGLFLLTKDKLFEQNLKANNNGFMVFSHKNSLTDYSFVLYDSFRKLKK